MQIVELEMVPLSLRPVLQRLYDMKTTQSALREGVLFSTKRNNYYYDTGTGKVIVLDDDTSYIFRVLFDPTLSAETFLISLTKVDPNAVKNLLQTIDAERLFQRPPLLSMGKEIAAGVTDTEQKVEQIILEVTEQCNFRCKYCVYSEDFSGNRDFGNRRMPTEIAFKAIDWALENSGAKLAITFYGGEPLLNFKLMKAVIERSQAKRGNKEIVYSFTSNMSLMTREIATYLAQVPNLYIMASIDGPRTVHDAYRVYANDAPTFEDSIGGLRILADAYAGSHMPVNINAVLTPPFGFEKLEQVNAYFESLDWLPATCHVNITYPSYGTCPGLDEYYDKITGNPKYALHGMCNPLMIAFLGILSTIAGVCPFLTLILSRAFLDSLARACGQQAFEMEIIWLLFSLFLTNMMLSVVNNLSILLKSDVSGRISLLVNAQVLEKCVHLPMSQYDNETTYNRIRFTSEQTSIRCTNLINTFFSIVQCLISFASVVCVLVSFNGIIVIASVVASIPLFFVNKYVSSFWYKISVGRVEKQRYSDVLRDLMLRNDNIKELKLFGSLSYLKSRILNQQTDFFREDQMNRKKFCKIDTAQKAANDFVILLLKLWIIILGIKQRATLGTINLYTSSLDQIQSAIFSFCTQLNTFYEQALYLESLFDLFDMQTEDENCGTPLTEPIRTIEFRHVYFSYPATNVYALKNVSFVLDDRHTYALIGLNGSGKTTLLKLLMKLYKPTLGTILINGQDIEEIDTAGLRKRISAIFQDFIKYPFTAEENITISDLENANDLHRLSKVIDDAGAAEVIDGLPHRLQTQLQKGWNGGTELSQGQWQKIAIARCLFKQSDVYLFDEPFSALDAISEQHIIKRLNLKTKMSITIFITHRYSSLRLADFILVLKDGELVESGSHQELQKAGKYYSELIKAQIEPIDHLAQLDET